MPTKMRSQVSEHTLLSRDVSDVSPCSPLDDLLDRCVSHPVLCGKGSKRAATVCVSLSDRDNVAFVDASRVVHRTSRDPMFASSLCQILSLSTPAQMTRIDAGRMIAEMQDGSLVADRRTVSLPADDTMREARSCHVVDGHSSVAVPVSCERPFDTLLSLVSENGGNVFSRLGRHTSKHSRGGQ